jgi:hypothetical protein
VPLHTLVISSISVPYCARINDTTSAALPLLILKQFIFVPSTLMILQTRNTALRGSIRPSVALSIDCVDAQPPALMQHEVEYAFSHKFCDFLLKYDGIYRQKLSTDYRAHVAMNIYLYLMNIYSCWRYMNLK